MLCVDAHVIRERMGSKVFLKINPKERQNRLLVCPQLSKKQILIGILRVRFYSSEDEKNLLQIRNVHLHIF